MMSIGGMDLALSLWYRVFSRVGCSCYSRPVVASGWGRTPLHAGMFHTSTSRLRVDASFMLDFSGFTRQIPFHARGMLPVVTHEGYMRDVSPRSGDVPPAQVDEDIRWTVSPAHVDAPALVLSGSPCGVSPRVGMLPPSNAAIHLAGRFLPRRVDTPVGDASCRASLRCRWVSARVRGCTHSR